MNHFNSAAKTSLGAALLAVGCAIYLLFRSKTLYIYVWCKWLGLAGVIDTLRLSVHGWQVPDFIRFSLPDGLYCAAWFFFIDAIWHDEKRFVKYVVILLVPFVTISSEILQYFGLVKGTFDVYDLFCYMIPPMLYFIYILRFSNLKLKHYEKVFFDNGSDGTFCHRFRSI